MDTLSASLTVDKISLKYYKTKKNNMYGFKIVKLEKSFIEEAKFEEFTYEEEYVENILVKLIEGAVTPITLKDIIEDNTLEYIRKNLQLKNIPIN